MVFTPTINKAKEKLTLALKEYDIELSIGLTDKYLNIWNPLWKSNRIVSPS